jgi:hypothetical protein
LVTNDVISLYFKFKEIAMANREIRIANNYVRNLESGAGKRRFSTITLESNVMKVERESVKHDDDSDQECFRKYNNHQNHLKITPYFWTS